MIHKTTNPELVELLKKRNSLVTEGRKISAQIDELETERNKIGLQINKVKEKIIPIAEEIMQPILQKYQMVTTTRLTPALDTEGKEKVGEFEDEVQIEWIDEVDEFKKILDERDAKNAEEEAKRKEEEANNQKTGQIGLGTVGNSPAQTNENTSN